MIMITEKHNNSLQNFPADLLVASGLPIVGITFLASWAFSVHGKAWIWAAASSFGVAALGTVLLLVAKLPLYRQRRFWTFGIHALPPASHRYYRWGCFCSIVGISAMLFLWLSSTLWR